MLFTFETKPFGIFLALIFNSKVFLFGVMKYKSLYLALLQYLLYRQSDETKLTGFVMFHTRSEEISELWLYDYME